MLELYATHHETGEVIPAELAALSGRKSHNLYNRVRCCIATGPAWHSPTPAAAAKIIDVAKPFEQWLTLRPNTRD